MYEDRIMRLARQKQQGLGSLGGPKKPFGQRQQPWKSSEGLSRDVNIEKELNKFQIRANEPTARAAEQQVFDDYRRQGLYPWNLHSRPSVNFEGGRRDIEGWEVRPVNIEKIPPKIQTGIFNTDDGRKMLAGTTEDKWGQLVRDGIVNPGDDLNHLQIDQLYNQYYEGGAGDMDQFGVV